MKKSLIKLFFANIIYLVINLIINFIFPKYLSIEAYALIKTYTLYIGYAGIFSLGYNDGMYLKYGGKSEAEIEKKDLGNNISNYLILELIMCVLILTYGLIINNNIIKLFAVGMLASNVLGYLKSLYQAIGDFSLYAKAQNLEKELVFIVSIISIFVFKIVDGEYFVWVQVIISIIVMSYLLIKFINKVNLKIELRPSFKEIKENISSGFILMLGNFSNIAFTSIDRIFIKTFLTATDFAFYSFAVSMENLINVFTTPITISMYNYLCKQPNKEKIRNIKNITLVWGMLVISAAFPIKWILENYLTKYIESTVIIFLILATQVFFIVIKGVYVNIYKAEKKQAKYLKQMTLTLVIGISLNLLFYIILKNVISFAIATLVTSIIWLIICEITEKEICFKLNEYIAIAIIIFIYLFIGIKINAILGFLIYIISVILITCIFMNKTISIIIRTLFDSLKKIRKK